MPLSTLTDSDRKEIARRYLDGAEHWLRRVAHHQFSKELGPSYLSSGPWDKDFVDRISKKLSQLPAIPRREIDATTFGELIHVICYNNAWQRRFADAFPDAFPPGSETARFFLLRLKDIRNKVSHGRGCSAHELARAICYTDDLITSLQAFFRKENMDRQFNVPMIVKYVDSNGNESNLEGVSNDINSRIIDWREGAIGDLWPGDTLVAEVEIDPSFSSEGYKVRWGISGALCSGAGRVATVLIGTSHVGEQFELHFEVVSNNEWHRQHGLDDRLTLIFRVLPPS